MDKLQVVDSCPAYLARGYFFRQCLVDAFDEGWWFDWMCNLSADRIAWRWDPVGWSDSLCILLSVPVPTPVWS